MQRIVGITFVLIFSVLCPTNMLGQSLTNLTAQANNNQVITAIVTYDLGMCPPPGSNITLFCCESTTGTTYTTLFNSLTGSPFQMVSNNMVNLPSGTYSVWAVLNVGSNVYISNTVTVNNVSPGQPAINASTVPGSITFTQPYPNHNPTFTMIQGMGTYTTNPAMTIADIQPGTQATITVNAISMWAALSTGGPAMQAPANVIPNVAPANVANGS